MTAGYYHLHLHPISRSKGHHIHAAVAYRHGTRASSMEAAAAYRHARNHGNGSAAFDYRGKIGVEWFGIVAPNNVPAWMRDPVALWRAVDASETRLNARMAQDVVIGLPHQVGLDDHIAMLTAFAKRYCVDQYRMIADIAIHAPPVHRGGDPRHWHAHILLTDRPADAEGFARTKDRRYSAKGLVDELRAGWTEVHNAHMEALGLPYRIDHRTLEQQRQDALARGDTAAALDLDRIPQIRLGKAVHTRHPDYAAFVARRTENRAILQANKERAAIYKDRIEAAVAKADNAAFLESRRNARHWAEVQAQPASYAELHTAYGRPRTPSPFGRLKDVAFAGEVTRRALALQREHGHPWFPSGTRPGSPSITDVLLPLVALTGPGHPMFTVTAKDLAFAFYGMGIIDLPQLQSSLHHVALEEQRLFAARMSAKSRPKPLPKRVAPKLSTPEADRLKRLQRALLVPRGIYLKRLELLRVFEGRYERSRTTTETLARRRYRAPLPP